MRLDALMQQVMQSHGIPTETIVQVRESLAQQAGGTHWYLPGPSKQARDEAIRAGYRQGTSPAALARRHGLSESRVRQILRP